jgi:hypothetical protein
MKFLLSSLKILAINKSLINIQIFNVWIYFGSEFSKHFKTKVNKV